MSPAPARPVPLPPQRRVGSPAAPVPTASLRRRSLFAGGLVLPPLALGAAGCTGILGSGTAPELRAELPRAEAGPPEEAGALAVPFTARLLGAIDRTDVNAVCSPLSAQVALTMIGMGAAGQTRAEMEEVLGGTMDELAAGANTLSQVLAVVGDEEREHEDDERPEPAKASLVNGTWLQEGLEVREEFLEDLATWFGSGVFEADFEDGAEREQARQEINGWVEEFTAGLIEELIPEDALTEDTRLVLVNALHLKAAWPEELSTSEGPFTTSDGEQRTVPMLSADTHTWYEDELCRATSLDTYGRDLALALVQPVQDVAEVLDAWAADADDPSAGLGALLTALADAEKGTLLHVPAFDITWESSLLGPLADLGMTTAFEDAADFSGVTDAPGLLIAEVLQKAVITIDEEGMEAAAATAVLAGASSGRAPAQELRLDRPFLYVAFERSTRAPLVLGWIGDPSQTR